MRDKEVLTVKRKTVEADFNPAKYIGAKNFSGEIRPIGKIAGIKDGSVTDFATVGDYFITVKNGSVYVNDTMLPLSKAESFTVCTSDGKEMLYISDGDKGVFFDGSVLAETVPSKSSVFIFSRLFVGNKNKLFYSDELSPETVKDFGEITLPSFYGDITDLIPYSDKLFIFTVKTAFKLFFSGNEYKLEKEEFLFDKIERGGAKIFGDKILFAADGNLYEINKSGSLSLIKEGGVTGAAIVKAGYYFIKVGENIYAFCPDKTAVKMNDNGFTVIKNAFIKEDFSSSADFDETVSDGKTIFRVKQNAYALKSVCVHAEVSAGDPTTLTVTRIDKTMGNKKKIIIKSGLKEYPVNIRGSEFFITIDLGSNGIIKYLSFTFASK
ncbi:MAG: hypothetical protein HP008_01390 [Clostridia bacterium]|nr:hypothetical protein [Clostridia bacterium]